MALSATIGHCSAKSFSTIEEITVTATKRVESVQDVPISISAMTETDIVNTGAQTLQDLAGSIPNFIFPSSRQPGEANISIRGVFSRITFSQIGFDPGFGVYLDGVYLGKNYTSNADLGEIERVEVLRGPQGTLFGKNTISGAINIVSKKPSNEFEGKIEGSVGNYDASSMKGSINVPIIKDILATRISFNRTRRDGYVTNTFLNDDDVGNVDRYAGRLQLAYTPTDTTTAHLNIDIGRSDSKIYSLEGIPDPDSTVSSIDSKRFTISADVQPESRLENLGGSLSIEHEFKNGYDFTAITGVRRDKQNASLDAEFRPIDGLSTFNNIGQKLWTQELRISSPADTWYDFVAGLYYLKQDNKSSQRTRFGQNFLGSQGPGRTGNTFADTSVDVTSYAAFIHGNLHVNERLTFFGGARYTDEKKELSYFQTSDPVVLLTNLGIDSGKIPIPVDVEDSKPSWAVGLRYAFSENIQTYGSVSRGVKSGAFNTPFAMDSATISDNLVLKPEFVTNYEIGFKSMLLEGRLRLNATLFYMDYEDLQVTVWDPTAGPIGAGAARWRNAAAVTSKGLELEVAFRPTDNLSLNGGVGYTDSTFDEFNGVIDPRTGNRVDAAGNQTPLAPEFTVNISIQHELPLSNGGIWLTRFDYSYEDEIFTQQGSANSPDDFVSSHSLVNARIGYASSDDIWGVHLWAKNLFDKEYLEESRFIDFIGRQFMRRYGEPRTYGLTVNYNF